MTSSDLAALRAGGKPALAAALTQIETASGGSVAARLLDEAFLSPTGVVTGFTGPPGVGKSTLIDALIRRWRSEGARVGVIAVDPSSQRSGGALLGDRIRMRTDPADDGVFVRSLASRSRLGGLADAVFPAAVLMRALFDRVVVESVGVGQSETEISAVADRVVLCIQPGSGDSLQFMKAGIMEIPDVAVVTKADMGAPARRALADLKGALGLASGGDIPCLAVSVTKGEGLGALSEALSETMAPNALAARRREQARHWLRTAIAGRFGEEGLRAAGQALAGAGTASPFAAAQGILEALTVTFAPKPDARG